MAKKSRPVVVAVTSDQHCGGTTAICPPGRLALPDQGGYFPSKTQYKLLWRGWEKYWWRVDQIRKEHKAQLVEVFNGDMVEGDHHHTSQIISRDMNVQERVADKVFGVPKGMLRPKDKVYVVKGTDTHVGDSEEKRAGWFGVDATEREGEGETFSWYHLRMRIHGLRFDVQHHGARMGRLPWTSQNGLLSTAHQIRMECLDRGEYEDWPHIALRGHIHQKGDSGPTSPYKTRLLVTPSWQAKTGYGFKVTGSGAGYADYGGVTIAVFPDERGETVMPNGISYTVEWITFSPELPTAVRL